MTSRVALTFVVALSIRLAVVAWRDIAEVDEFGITDNLSSPSNWKEFLFASSHGLPLDQRHVDPYPWLLHFAAWTGQVGSSFIFANGWWILCVVDAMLAAGLSLSASSLWSSWLHALCPVALLAAHLQSAASVQHALLFVVVLLCGAQKFWALPTALRIMVALFFAKALETEYLAVSLAIVSDVVHKSPRRALWSNVILLMLGGVLVLLDDIYGQPRLPTRLHNMSPDVGPAWYLWQLLPPVFDRPYSIIMRWMPLLMTAPLALRSSVLDAFSSTKNIQERRYVVASWAVASAISCRRTCSLLDVVFIGKLWAVFTPGVVQEMRNLFVPLVGTCMCIPLQRAFYRGWVTMRVANANWLFFACVFQMAAFIMFQVSYIASYLKRIR